MKDPNQEHCWTTEEEIKFINKLSAEARTEYAKGLRRKINWGRIDCNRIMELVEVK